MGGRIPESAAKKSTNIGKRQPLAESHNFQLYNPCWRIGNFDLESKWGLSSLLGKFKFSYSESLLQEVIESGIEPLNDILTSLDGHEFDSVENFWISVNQCNETVPTNIIRCISKSLFRYAFFEKVYPKLKEFENNTWEEIRLYSHGKGKSNNHNVSIQKLCKEARERLDILGFSDHSEIYSLRLDGKLRIYGFKELNYLDIIWIDFNHEIYPTSLQ